MTASATTPHRGGAPVGYLRELGPVEAGAVLYLRLWCDGLNGAAAQAGADGSRAAPAPSGPATPGARMQADFHASLDPESARIATSSFEELCRMCLAYGRRPLWRHHVDCACVGADESCFANFVAYATDGAREDAMLMASLLVRADMAPCLVSLAESFGLALRRMSLATEMPDGRAPARLH
ncbi:hypothetical protein [Pseudooceanicola aestuarii]|uniref:hypothetical protein n=1 Tax=Pseudooceanicola aestuarii TaxID=2697319 RepID=UPI0013D4FCA9|nr:hypothetical protein [Pseudooceanicola aestuarii]